jgi:hypothetical protein
MSTMVISRQSNWILSARMAVRRSRILLHGYMGSRRSYDRVLVRMEIAERRRRIAAWSRRHDRPLEGYDPADFAADVIRLWIS